MRRTFGILTLLLITILGATADSARAAYWLEEVVSGLGNPLYVTSPPGDLERLFILETGGRIMIVDNGILNPVPFLDLMDITVSGGEQGLLGMAFHPDYANNGYFYINHTVSIDSCGSDGGCVATARYTVSADPDVADPASRASIMNLGSYLPSHNAGMIEFGPDGYLWFGTGDGGGGGDQQNNSQNDGVLLGKMLRIDVDGAFPYAIPPDNPFVGAGDPLDEIWAKGLRNPWRFSFDRLTGDIWLGDVGQALWEEIDFQPASSTGGENYGWRLMEGNHCFLPHEDCDPGGLIYPIHEYAHGPGCSVTGGYVYRGGMIPELQGLYLYADFCTGDIFALDPADSSVTQIMAEEPTGSIVSFGEDEAGELYICYWSRVYKIVGDATGVQQFPVARSGLRFDSANPNPFAGETRVTLQIEDVSGAIDVGVYTVGGRRIANLHSGEAGGGSLRLVWDGRETSGKLAASGVYFIRANAGAERAATRVVHLR